MDEKSLQKISPEEQVEKERQRKALRKFWRGIRPFLVGAISIGLCILLLSKVAGKLLDEFYYPVDRNDATPITVTVPSSYGASAIAKLLYEACGEGEVGLINSKAAFKVYVDFTGKSGKLRAGTYILSKNMDVAQMVDVICAGNPAKATVRFTIPEGTDVEGIAAKLKELGILEDTSAFLELCKTGTDFSEYAFISAIGINEEQARDYLLEGYLFPDTYEIYTDASEKTIINKMLLRFFEVFTDEYAARATELDLTTDDVINMASLIEKEAKLKTDFSKVAAVFYNRISEDMTLGSDAPLRYIFKTNTLDFTAEQMADTSLYNTHVYKGLPLGPITNPGKNAIEAALWPDEEYMSEGYLYFCLKDGETGELVYAKTLEEHEANVEKYRPNW